MLVDQARLRRIRFPSINHLQFEPLHAVKPVVLENQLVRRASTTPSATLREQTPNRILLPNTSNGCTPQFDAGFLQNGRLNDVTSNWYIQPFSLSTDLMFSCGLKEPRWISMVAPVLQRLRRGRTSCRTSTSWPPTWRRKQDRLVASVRHNGQVFRLVKFPPVKTLADQDPPDQFHRPAADASPRSNCTGRFRPRGRAGLRRPGRREHLHGQLSRGVDSRDQDTARVAPAPLMVSQQQADRETGLWHARRWPRCWPAATPSTWAGPLARTAATAWPSRPRKPTPCARAAWALPRMARSTAGCCCAAATTASSIASARRPGTELWSVRLGQRLFGCPVAVGEDAFLANDAAEAVAARPGLRRDYEGGFAVGQRLRLAGHRRPQPAADHRRRLPAQLPRAGADARVENARGPAHRLDAGRRRRCDLLADQKGTARAVALADGKVLWQTELGDEFCRCPVVRRTRSRFGCRGGTLAVLNRADGKLLWSKKVESRFDYEPLLLQQAHSVCRPLTFLPLRRTAHGVCLLLATASSFFRDTKAMLANLADGLEEPLEVPGGQARVKGGAGASLRRGVRGPRPAIQAGPPSR